MTISAENLFSPGIGEYENVITSVMKFLLKYFLWSFLILLLSTIIIEISSQLFSVCLVLT